MRTLQPRKDTLELLKERASSPMKVHEEREMTIYRSSNLAETGKYFTNDRETPAYLELVVFRYKSGFHELYLQYPNQNFYIELNGSMGSARGSMKKYNIRNVLQEIISPYEYKGIQQPFYSTMYRHDEDLILVDSSEFNFFKRFNGSKEEVFQRNYVQIPDLRSISYAYKIGDKYLIVDNSEFNFAYETMRCFYGTPTNMDLCPMSNFARYRDGGTTLFTFDHKGEEHAFFSPPGLGGKKGDPMLDETIIMEDMDQKTKDYIIKELGINIHTVDLKLIKNIK